MRHAIALSLISGLLGACTPAQSPSCAELRPALEACPTLDVESVMTACEADEEGHAMTAELAQAGCPVEPGKADGLLQRTFVEVCTAGMLAGSLIMRARSPFGVPLPEKIKTAFRPYFGDLVDQVRIHYHARLLDDLPFHQTEYLAQTFGNHIYMTEPCSEDTHKMVTLLSHEMTHSKQTRDRHGETAFSAAYCDAYWRVGFNYDANPLEQEARSYGNGYVAVRTDPITLTCN